MENFSLHKSFFPFFLFCVKNENVFTKANWREAWVSRLRNSCLFRNAGTVLLGP